MMYIQQDIPGVKLYYRNVLRSTIDQADVSERQRSRSCSLPSSSHQESPLPLHPSHRQQREQWYDLPCLLQSELM